MEEDELKEQIDNRPWLFKKGVSGNPMGRPPGRSLKDRAKAYLSGLTDDEAEEYFAGMNKKDVWEMAEGRADTKLQGDANSPITLVLQDINGNSIAKKLQGEGIPESSTTSSTEV